MALRIALATPFGPPSVRGNAVTASRIAAGIAQRGVHVRMWDLSTMPASEIEREIEQYRPDVLHAFHAIRVGPLALRLARRLEIPLVVTLTGTDANHDLFDTALAPVMRGVLEGAATVVVFHDSVGEEVMAALPDLRPKLAVIPQAVTLHVMEGFDLDAHWVVPPDAVLFLLPAGLRPVKNPLLPLEPLGRLVLRQPQVRLLYAGPVLDDGMAQALQSALEGLSWARHIGEVPREQMASLLNRADVVLNCSISEGGMANSVLEALALGRAVLASDIPGNRSVIEDGVTGLLFRDAIDFEACAAQLVLDPELRARLGTAGRTLMERRYPPEHEIEGYLALYERLVPAPAA
jgi:glycosyltransferase involved in cell wall biosynthesis